MNTDETLDSAVVTVIYDNLVYDDRFTTSHGFACVVDVRGPETETRILFDTGGDGSVLAGNLSLAGRKCADFDAVVISHNHWDHAGGLEIVLQRKPEVTVYLPEREMAGQISQRVPLKNPVFGEAEPNRVAHGVWTTGVIENRKDEQGLVLSTPKGLAVITGCAHPGIVRMVKAVEKRFGENVFLILGGFHRPPTAAARELRSMGVKYAAPSHCTGEESTRAMKKAFDEGFIESGAGRVVRIE
jgi:7,8-dihydropterin-6-yl-methyl-4-(beta-D-ribofuranosyl)aminobenzene 5'-phosphate synthase